MEEFKILCFVIYIISIIIMFILTIKDLKDDSGFILFLIFCPLLNTVCIIYVLCGNIIENLKK